MFDSDILLQQQKDIFLSNNANKQRVINGTLIFAEKVLTIWEIFSH